MTKTEHDMLIEYGAEEVSGFGPYRVKIGAVVTADADRAVMLIKQIQKEKNNGK